MTCLAAAVTVIAVIGWGLNRWAARSIDRYVTNAIGPDTEDLR